MKNLVKIIVSVGILCSGIIIGIDQHYKNLRNNELIVEVANKQVKYDKMYHIGDKVKVAKYDVQVHSAGYLSYIENLGIKLDNGYQLYTINATVTNNTDKPIEGSMLFDTKLYVDNTFYNVEYNTHTTTNSLEKNISPGEAVTGDVVFQIPKNARDIKLIYISTVWEYRIVINLDKQIAIQRKVS